MRRLTRLMLLLTALSIPTAASAQVSLLPKIGTLGIGADISVSVLPMISARGGVGFMPYEPEGTFSETEWKVGIPHTLTAGLDFSPPIIPLRISAGALYRTGDLELDGIFTGEVEVGGETYDGDDVGNLTGAVEHGSLSPFVTIGTGIGLPGIGIRLDGGVAFLGDPTLVLEADGPISDEPEFQAALERERADVEDDLDLYARYYPIVNLSVSIGL